MLLRSSSSPVLSSFTNHHQLLESEHIIKLPRTISFLSLSQNLGVIDLQNSSSPKKTIHVSCNNVTSSKIKERNEVKVSQQKYTCMKAKPFPSPGLDGGVMDHIKFGGGKKNNAVQTSVMDGGMGSNGGCICGGCKGGGRGSDGGHGRGWNNFHEGNNNGRDRTDAYYQNMIEANPGDALLLGNYAKFLKEVCGDYTKAEEYLERAILANPGDGHNLSLYADLIWQTEKNADRAEGYFDQAIKNAPDDCYVMASYAKFLWDAEDEEEDKECQNESDHNHAYPTDHFHKIKHLPSLTAASSKALVPLFLVRRWPCGGIFRDK